MAAAREPGRSSGRLPIGAAAFALVAFVLAVVGLAIDAGAPTVDVFYRAMQLFALESSVTPGNPVHEVARFLAPLSTVTAVLVGLRALLGDELRRRRIARTTGHAIVCGDDDAALALARNLRADGRAVVLVGSVGAELSDASGIPAVHGDPSDVDILRAAGIAGATALYACARHSAANAAVALAVGRLRDPTGARLSTYAQVRSDDLVEALGVRRLTAARPETVTIDFFAIDDIAARALLDRHPTGPATPVVCGFGELGKAVVRAIVRRPGAPADAGVPPQVRALVVAAAVEAAVRAEATDLDAQARGWEVRTGSESDGEGVIYVCLDDEEAALATGLRLADTGGRDVVVCLRRASPFQEAFDRGGKMRIFGVLDEACREDAIVADSIVGRAARAIHERYRVDAIRRGDTVVTNASVVPWHELPSHLQESNYAQAEHMGAKLSEIGASLVSRPPAVPFMFTEDELGRLARLEHRRWMDERLAAGFVHGPRREGRQHPNLVDWPELSPETRQKDVDAVRQLPDVLADGGLYIARSPAA